MKREFTGLLVRLLGGGTRLTEVEFELLNNLVMALPTPLQTVVEAQFEAYNLVQREVDGRALNFYRKKSGRFENMDGLPLLQMACDEAPLVRLTATLGDEVKPVHATLTAVNGRVFRMTLGRAVRSYAAKTKVKTTETHAAWRSNFKF